MCVYIKHKYTHMYICGCIYIYNVYTFTYNDIYHYICFIYVFLTALSFNSQVFILKQCGLKWRNYSKFLISILVLHMLKYKLKISIPDPKSKIISKDSSCLTQPFQKSYYPIWGGPQSIQELFLHLYSIAMIQRGKKDNRKSKQNIKSNTKNKN